MASATGTDIPDTRPLWQRIVFRIPVLGWMLRDVMEGDEDNVFYAIGTLVALWTIAIMLWGYPALILPALALVPVCFLLILLITWG
ncbi:hypothetical protein DDZ14_03045 [Maritimibacter sp. 55A14]|uniref:hypothetical protein n=1 Tax=Maritimibacter sp. 55A14 TaxID=2174844 RepID=UPI000D612851|nr:hypothetical protein [Maritimibacter sp. 55A14]PWE33661.1 hypothetical protein DDZ14_03045 [Maritimibacter sp. 55A14]